jgi:hypothetical protein
MDKPKYGEGLREHSLAEMMAPKPLEYYRNLLQGRKETTVIKVQPSNTECAAILKAYDHGIAALNKDELSILDCFMSKLKEQIWP